MTSEDKANVNPVPADAADKPKRGRKRKTEAVKLSGQAFQVAVESQKAHAFLPEGTETPSPADDSQDMASTPHAPEEYGAAMALENAPQHGAAMALGSGCGNLLKAAREAQGLSIHEVCSHLRLGIKQIQAIEQDDFEKLPQPSIVRGFIRNYARLLNIDAAPILEAYQRIVPNKAPLPLSVRSNATPSVIDKPPRVIRPQRILTLLIFLVLAGILAYFYINHVKPQALKNASLALDVGDISETTGQEIAVPAPGIEPPPAPAPVTEATPSAETPEQLALPPVADSANTTPAESLAVPPVSDSAAPATLPAAAGSTLVSTPTPATGVTADAMTLKANDSQKITLSFRVSEESWVRIENMQGKKIFSEVLTAGSDHQVVAEKPVNVIVGNASVTQLTIDSQPYDLTQATRGRVARIQLK